MCASVFASLGCVLYELCTLKHAFDAQNLLGLVWKIVSESYPPIPDFYSAPLHGLVASMLAKDPALRPSIDVILELPFIRERLHSQIKAKIMLKSKTKGDTGANSSAAGSASGSGGGNSPSKVASASAQQRSQPATARPSANPNATTASFQPNSTMQPPSTVTISTAPANGRSHSASAVPVPSPAAAAAAAVGGLVPPSPSSATPFGPTGTLRARPTPILDVGDRSPQASSTPTAATSARGLSANRAAPAASPHSSSFRDGAPGPMLSPSEQLQKRKQVEADRRARELYDAARSGQSDRAYAQQRTQAEFRGSTAAGVPRPNTSSQQHYQLQQATLPSYQTAFDDEGDVPAARQRSAGSARGQSLSNDGSSSGRAGLAWPGTPSRAGAPAYDYAGAYPSSPLPMPSTPSAAAAAVAYEDRPIKSSGSYRLGAPSTAATSGAVLSPAALQARSQAAHQQALAGGSASPPSARTNSSRGFGHAHTRDEGDFGGDSNLEFELSQPGGGGAYGAGAGAGRGSFSSSSGQSARPNSVSASSSSSRVTRVRDESDDDETHGHGGAADSYSDDEFDQYDDEDDAVVHELERTYTATRIGGPARSPRTLPASERPVSSPNYHAAPTVPASRAVRPVSSVTPSSHSSNSGGGGPVGSSFAANLSSGASVPPSMGSKQEAVRARCLRFMSPSEFDEVCEFFRARKRDGAAGLSKEELAAKFGANNEQVVFQVEQFVYLSDLLNDVGGAGTGTGTSGGGAQPSKPSGSGSGSGAIKPPSTPSSKSAAGTPTKAMPSSASATGRKTINAKPTSATSRTATPTASATRAAAAAAGSKKK